MVYDQPMMSELDLMFTFCSRHKHLFIYGCEEKQTMLYKYLEMSGVSVAGYVISRRMHWETSIKGVPVYLPEELEGKGYEKENTAFLMALPGTHYNEVLCSLQSLGYRHVFYLSEYNKNTIAYKMRPRTKEQFWLEVNLADHCNLDCQMCDHYSQFAKPRLLDLEVYRRDMERLSDLMDGTMGIMKLQGGEPLLNRQTGEIIKMTRKYFPDTRIFLFTNGLLLLQCEKWEEGNLWQCFHDYDVEVQLTVYGKIQKKAQDYGVKLMMFKEAANRDDTVPVKTSVKHTHDLSGQQDSHSFISCYQFNESIVLRNGKIYTCPMIPYSVYLEKQFSVSFERCGEDGIDIYSVDSYEEIAEFVARRAPFCRYCNVRNRKFQIPWRQSGHSLSEYI